VYYQKLSIGLERFTTFVDLLKYLRRRTGLTRAVDCCWLQSHQISRGVFSACPIWDYAALFGSVLR
jgi:hypothetical protein